MPGELRDLESVVKEMVYLRKKLGINQKALARRAGVSQSLVAKIESSWARPKKGKKIQPSYEVVRRLYNTLLSEYYRHASGRTVRDVMSKRIVYVNANDSVKRAIALMKKNDFSQLPVKEEGSYVGSIVSNDLLDVDYKTRVSEVMGPCFTIVPDSMPIENARELMKTARRKALLVQDSETGRIVGIVTPHDVM